MLVREISSLVRDVCSKPRSPEFLDKLLNATEDLKMTAAFVFFNSLSDILNEMSGYIRDVMERDEGITGRDSEKLHEFLDSLKIEYGRVDRFRYK